MIVTIEKTYKEIFYILKYCVENFNNWKTISNGVQYDVVLEKNNIEWKELFEKIYIENDTSYNNSNLRIIAFFEFEDMQDAVMFKLKWC